MIDGGQLLMKTAQKLRGCWNGFLLLLFGPLISLLVLTIAVDLQRPSSSVRNIPNTIVVIATFIFVAWFIVTRSPHAVTIYKYKGKVNHLKEYIEELGARRPVASEMDKIVTHLERIVQHGGESLLMPEAWFVVTDRSMAGATVGDIIFLDHNLFGSPFLGVAVVQEIVRANNKNGRMRMALKHLNRTLEELPYRDEWKQYWREQAFAADEFTAKVGYKYELLRSLEMYQPLEVAKPYYEQEEPFIAERIERLERLQA